MCAWAMFPVRRMIGGKQFHGLLHAFYEPVLFGYSVDFIQIYCLYPCIRQDYLFLDLHLYSIDSYKIGTLLKEIERIYIQYIYIFFKSKILYMFTYLKCLLDT